MIKVKGNHAALPGVRDPSETNLLPCYGFCVELCARDYMNVRNQAAALDPASPIARLVAAMDAATTSGGGQLPAAVQVPGWDGPSEAE